MLAGVMCVRKGGLIYVFRVVKSADVWSGFSR